MLGLAVALALTQLPFETQVELSSGERVDLTADHLQYHTDDGVISVDGHATFKTERVLVRADAVTYDQQNQRVVAKGHVMAVMAPWIAVADQVVLNVETVEADVTAGTIMLKKNVSAEALWAAKTPDELKRLGQTGMVLHGRHIQQLGPDRFAVDGASFTPCDCDLNNPTWRIDGSHAEITLNQSATVTWPVVYVHDVPVLPAPWLYVPLGERR